ncbi:type IV pilus assembly protein PilC [Clostridium moniliforme]|uniref:Type IV pilus assembly protein PilC n=1 Tax=Clostridium moniliforme TaxID=39489 RepID=A0ABS4EXN6_9CLOT|nr:type II secretion system F family protein [Clostridium moniliforme]MBP1888760.1 type IV pilus assembly protein PilC [Clostridium moniliforme]
MPLYKYKAKNLDGKVIKGKIDIENSEELRKLLRERGFFLVDYEDSGMSINIDLGMFRKIPKKDISIFCREMYFSLTSGISIVQSLEIVKEQIENKKLKNILYNVFDDIKRGRMLSDAFKQYDDLPNLFIYMLQVGEETGRLDEVMGNLADYYNNQYKQEKKIKNALIYPKFLLCFSLIVVSILVAFVVPIFVQNLLSANEVLPVPTKIVIWISSFIKNKWMYIIAFLIVISILKIFILNKNKKYIYFKDRFIVNSKFIRTISMQIFTSRFARTFSILFGGGVNVTRCIEICADVIGNEFIKSRLLQSKEFISNGSSIAEGLGMENTFPKMLIQSIRVGEESGTVEEILKKASEFYDSEANFALEKLSNLVEPIMIILLAFLVGFVVISLVLPIFSMYDAVK